MEIWTVAAWFNKTICSTLHICASMAQSILRWIPGPLQKCRGSHRYTPKRGDKPTLCKDVRAGGDDTLRLDEYFHGCVTWMVGFPGIQVREPQSSNGPWDKTHTARSALSSYSRSKYTCVWLTKDQRIIFFKSCIFNPQILEIWVQVI